jgi:hypothetical protein
VNANVNGPRVCTRRARTRRSHSRSRPAEPTTGRTQCGGRLAPWADPLTGALGWQVLTASRCLALAMAGECGTARSHGGGEWHVRTTEPALTVAVTAADDITLWCRPDNLPDSCSLTVAFAPWTLATVLKCPVTTLPSWGTLSVRDVRITTRMGRTVRYLVPQFTPS